MNHSQQFLKRRKFLVLLPLIVMPFVTLVFWLLGGGAGVAAEAAPVARGLNTQLPDTKAGTSMVDKMSFYAMADKDSLKRSEQERMDPNYTAVVVEKTSLGSGKLNTSIGLSKPDHTEEEINRKLKELRSRLDEPLIRKPAMPVVEMEERVQPVFAPGVDPDMQEINNTLEKLLDVQHPERVKERLVEKKGVVYAVSVNSEGNDGGDFFGKADSVRTSFYSSATVGVGAPGVITAVIHGAQVLQSGFVVKMRLLKDVFVNGSKIPLGSFVYGTAEIVQERLKVFVTSIQYDKNLFPVSLTVYDMNGLEGIYIPGSAAREVVKQEGDQSVQSLGIVNMDPSLKAQAAAAGIGAAKRLLSKKVKQVRVTVKSNYMVLLKDAKDK